MLSRFVSFSLRSHVDSASGANTDATLTATFRVNDGVVRRVLVPSRTVCFRGHAMPTLGGHISVVGSLVAKKEVRRIATRRIVAAMENTLSFGDFAVGQFPCDTMGAFRFGGCLVELPIAESSLARSPDPTTIRPGALVNLGPKSLAPRHRFHTRNLTLFSYEKGLN